MSQEWHSNKQTSHWMRFCRRRRCAATSHMAWTGDMKKRTSPSVWTSVFSVAFRIWGAATIPTRSRIAMHSALVHQLFLLLFFQVSGTVLVDLKQSTMRVDTIAWLMNACWKPASNILSAWVGCAVSWIFSPQMAWSVQQVENSDGFLMKHCILYMNMYIYISLSLASTHFFGVSQGCYLTEVGASLYPIKGMEKALMPE